MKNKFIFIYAMQKPRIFMPGLFFCIFAAAGRFIVPIFCVGEESPGNAGRRAS